jgi:hypothetical protein
MGKKAKAKREAKATVRQASGYDRFKASDERRVDSIMASVKKALKEDDRAELERIEAAYPALPFEDFTYSEAGGPLYSFPRAAGRANRKNALAFFADHLAKRAPFDEAISRALSDTFVAADTAIYLSVANQKWTEKEATKWLLEAFDKLIRAFSQRELDNLSEANTLSQACPEYQEAFRKLIWRERGRRESALLDGPGGAQEPNAKSRGPSGGRTM